MGRPLATLVGFAVACALVLVLAPGASAHARLLAETPSNGTHVVAAPASVTLDFDQHVTVVPGAIEVIDPTGAQIQSGTATVSGHTLTQTVRADSTAGVYSVSWHVTSADGHQVGDIFSYSIGAGATGGNSTAIDAAKHILDARERTLHVFTWVRAIMLLALMVVAGGGIFAAAIAPEWHPRGLIALTCVLVLAQLFAFGCDAAAATGSSLSGMFHGSVLHIEASSQFGRTMLVGVAFALVSLVVSALLARPARSEPTTFARMTFALVYVALAASYAATGHDTTYRTPGLSVTLAMLHLVAAAIWLGGLVQMGLLARSAASHANAIERFSAAAFGCVVVLVATGIVETGFETGWSVHAVLHTHWGRILCGKLVLFALTIPMAALNKYVTVPAIRARPRDAGRLLFQYVCREGVVVTTLIVLASWLAYSVPPK